MQGIATFEYGSEYMGDFQRLVLTPAIEKHVVAVTAATFMHAAACTSGAVSTGKTGIIKVNCVPHHLCKCRVAWYTHLDPQQCVECNSA